MFYLVLCYWNMLATVILKSTPDNTNSRITCESVSIVLSIGLVVESGSLWMNLLYSKGCGGSGLSILQRVSAFPLTQGCVGFAQSPLSSRRLRGPWESQLKACCCLEPFLFGDSWAPGFVCCVSWDYGNFCPLLRAAPLSSVPSCGSRPRARPPALCTSFPSELGLCPLPELFVSNRIRILAYKSSFSHSS